MTDTAPPPDNLPTAMPVLPPLPVISWPSAADRRQAAMLLGQQMAEAEARWQLRARAMNLPPVETAPARLAVDAETR